MSKAAGFADRFFADCTINVLFVANSSDRRQFATFVRCVGNCALVIALSQRLPERCLIESRARKEKNNKPRAD